MTNNWLRRLLSFERAQPPRAVDPGLYHMMQETDGTFVRFHLRVENDGSGMLIANAMAAARLSPSGVVIAKDLLEGLKEEEIIRELREHFSNADPAVIHRDVEQVAALINELKAPGDTYPVLNLEDPSLSPDNAELISPLQAAVPLGGPDALLPLLDRIWGVAIPHITLLIPDAFEPLELIRVVEHAEDLGMITGVRGRATNLWDEVLLTDLRSAGIDHITFLYASADAEIHDALCGAGDHAAAMDLLAWLEGHQISAVAEIPLIQATIDVLDDTVETLLAHGADNLAFVAYATTDDDLADEEGIFDADAMAQVATTVEETANMAQALFIWDPPVERDPRMSLKDQILLGPRCSGDVAVRIEPTGEVIPPRGAYQSAGNLIHDSWEHIWNDAVFQRYRERVEAPTRCEICPELAICAADCPRDRKGWAQSFD
jgi:radical SAM protein with 4Fe4S-binding SPASM domain